MQSENQNKFIENSVINSLNKDQQNILNTNITIYNNNLNASRLQFSKLDLARKRAGSIKHRVLKDLDKYLIEFEASFTKRGGKVIWSVDSEQALNDIFNIIAKNDAHHIVKSKSVLSQEIELSNFLKSKNIDLSETDLVEFINKGISNDKSSGDHNTLSSYSKNEIYQYLVQKYGISKDKKIADIIGIISKIQRENFIKADIGIVEADFIIADIGGVAISENDGNSSLSSSFPKVNIVLVSIERLIPNLQDLDLYLPLLSTYKNAQKVSTYNTILTGPRQDNEIDGPVEMYVILIDNNRSEILSKKEQRIAMSCLQCVACSNFCPVYKIIGEKTYQTVYKGPIGSVTTPFLKGVKEYSHLSYASTLCGKCSEVCPVNIPIHELLLHNRNDFYKNNESSFKEKALIWGWKKIILNRKLMDFGSPGIKSKVIALLFSKLWGSKREIPGFATKNFHQMWKEKMFNS